MSKIEWCDETINPIIGCSKKSSGCKNCYAEKMAVRLQTMGVRGYDNVVKDGKWTGKVSFIESELRKPFKWKKSKRIFVGSMTDLFHDNVSYKLVDKIWDMFFQNPQHTFLVLTKRPKNMKKFIYERAYSKHFGWGNDKKPAFKFGELIHIDELYDRNMCGYAISANCSCNNYYHCAYPNPKQNKENVCEHGIGKCYAFDCPLGYNNPHIWQLKEHNLENEGYEIDEDGYSVDCDYITLEARPKYAFIKNLWLGVSIENQKQADKRIPLLTNTQATIRFLSVEPMLEYISIEKYLEKIDWVICGGGSGANARALNPSWVRSLKNQCQKANVPFFFKQWGGNNKKKNGRLLDGKIYEEFPK